MANFVLAMTGASGAPYALRLLQVLVDAGHDVQLLLSHAATRVLSAEVGLEVDLAQPDLDALLKFQRRPLAEAAQCPGQVRYHSLLDFNAPVASGSAPSSGMIVCPCSMGTLASIAQGISSNLIHRAADVHLKERRKLIVVPRETPLSAIHLENMQRLTTAGGVVLPAMPGFYHQPTTLDDLVDFIVGRICDQLGLSISLTPRWGT
ncbi:MAG: UbiX family flavin prenyltransferase [Planctomycetaceae bacterium]|nr:UbiX family flavin prenyltransferase [Planctomycetaceae bacterium]